MRCEHCGSEWNAGQAVGALKSCPFCGASLEKKRNLDSLDAVLAEIIERFGVEMLSNGQRTIGLFSDLAPALTKERRMLAYLVECGGHTALLAARSANAAERKTAVEQVVTRLREEVLLSDELARTVCLAFWQSVAGPEQQPEPVRPAAPTPEPPRPAAPPREPVRPAAPAPESQRPAAPTPKPPQPIPVLDMKVYEIEEHTLLAYKGADEVVYIPEGVHTIGEEAFQNNRKIRQVHFPASLRRIASHAFEGCSQLREVHWGASRVREVGGFAFCWCDCLESITIPDTVKSIGYCVFQLCRRLRSVQLPDGLEDIGCGAFECCSNLEGITIPGSVETLYDDTFKACYRLEEVILRDGVKSLRRNAFRSCAHLKRVHIPDSVTTVNRGVFTGCTELVNIQASEKWKKQFRSRLPFTIC